MSLINRDIDRLVKPILSLTIIGIIFGVLASSASAKIAHPKIKNVKDTRCSTSARYEAMREAYERRRPNPCGSAENWVR
ncbi:uncharacterized membrane protein (DUF106 family) [Bradyrhizobium sp. i1.4.4]